MAEIDVIAKPAIVGVFFLGAEGYAEAEEAPWLRDATAAEVDVMLEGSGHKFHKLAVDDNGRPYFPVAVMEHATLDEAIREKARRVVRCVRLD